MQSYTSSFIDFLSRECHASQHTLRSYRTDLGLFEEYLRGAVGTDFDLAALDAKKLRGFSAWMHSKQFAPSTIARRLACVRALFKFLRRSGAVSGDPTS